MRMSDEGRRRLTAREGVRLKAYKDSVGVWTIGIGHTSAAGSPKVTPGLTITRGECDAIFKRDLVQYEDAVNKAVKVPLAQHQFDACVSLCYNIGVGAFAKSTVVKRINAGDMEGAAAAFMLWSKPPAIIGRRKTEAGQFRTPYRAVSIAAAPVLAEEVHEEAAIEEPAAPAAPPAAPAPSPLAGSVVEGDPELWSVQRRLKAMNYNPGGTDGKWGGMTAGAISGFMNDRQMTDGAPTSLDAFNAVREDLKAEIGRAESESFTRPISVERANADAAKVEQTAPEVVPVKRNFIMTAWAALVTFFTGLAHSVSGYVKEAWAFFTDHKDDLPTGETGGLLSTAWDYFGRVPALVWFALAACGLAFVAWNSHKGVQRITQSVQTGERQ